LRTPYIQIKAILIADYLDGGTGLVHPNEVLTCQKLRTALAEFGFFPYSRPGLRVLGCLPAQFSNRRAGKGNGLPYPRVGTIHKPSDITMDGGNHFTPVPITALTI
jgi:hypothetical protein